MGTEPYEDLPRELRPPSVRRRAMRAVGVLLVFVGAALLLGAGVWWTASHVDVAALPSGERHHLSLAVMGGVSLAHGLIAVAVVDAL